VAAVGQTGTLPLFSNDGRNARATSHPSQLALECKARKTAKITEDKKAAIEDISEDVLRQDWRIPRKNAAP